MAEYIEREHLAELLKEDIDLCGEKNSSTKPIAYGTALGLEMALRYVYAVGTADVVEVRHGKWEKDPIAIRDDGEIYDYRCSVCTARAHKGEYGNYDYFTSYCPNCGAKMDGKDLK